MPWDADEAEDAFLDYIGEHETGFIPGSLPGPELIDLDTALRRLVYGTFVADPEDTEDL